MTRDYKNTHRKKKPKNPIPGWVWLLTGLTVGLLVAFLVYLDTNTPESLSSVGKQAKSSTAKDSKKKSSGKAISNTLEKLKYEFYTLLPESEVVIPEREISERIEQMKKNSSHKSPEDYLLQAGSFKTQPQAESFKAKLAFIGIQSDIQTVSIGDDTWYRVRVGPFKNLVEINEIRSRLRENSINAILVKTTK